MNGEEEEKLWKGHLDKKCPKCGSELELQHHVNFGFGPSDKSRRIFDTIGVFLSVPPQPNQLHAIYYVACTCGYQKRTHERFVDIPVKNEEKQKKKKEFSEKVKNQIL